MALLLTVSDPYPAVSLPSAVHHLGQKKMPWTVISSFVLWSVSVFYLLVFCVWGGVLLWFFFFFPF